MNTHTYTHTHTRHAHPNEQQGEETKAVVDWSQHEELTQAGDWAQQREQVDSKEQSIGAAVEQARGQHIHFG